MINLRDVGVLVTSCGGMSNETMRRSVLTMLSVHGMMQNRPTAVSRTLAVMSSRTLCSGPTTYKRTRPRKKTRILGTKYKAKADDLGPKRKPKKLNAETKNI